MHNPFVPETLEGWSVLHLVFRVDWPRLGGLPPGERARMAAEASRRSAPRSLEPADGATALVQLLGHKGDLMVIAFRPSFDELGRVELALARTGLHGYLHADLLVRVDRRARDVRDDGQDPPAAWRDKG